MRRDGVASTAVSQPASPPLNDNDRLIQAIHQDRLADVDHPDAKAACQAIGRRTADDVEAVIAHLGHLGISAEIDGDPAAPAQRHHATLRFGRVDQAISAASTLLAHGYQPWQPIEGAAGAALRRTGSSLTVARTTDVTTVLDLGWPSPTGPVGAIPDILIPNESDYAAIDLPARLWPLYFALRPVRLLAERIGRRTPAHTLGPFLSTPLDLIPPLLDLAAVAPTDILVDLGCGDGRVLAQAVKDRGCRAVGVESNPDLVAEARRRVAGDGLGDRVQIFEGDASGDQLPAEASDGTVFFLFVPAAMVTPVVRRILDRTPPGTRLVAHEQHPLPAGLTPSRTTPLIRGQGVTVGHLFTSD